MKKSQQLLTWIQKHTTLLIALLIVCFVILGVTYSILKLYSLSYNALDLGIYRQVLTHSIHGDLFGMTIHPHSYLGDHMELLLVVLVPVYRLFPYAETLLALQVLAIATSIILALRLIPSSLSKYSKLIVAIVISCSPLIHNILAFEFHFLPFAIPLLLAACVSYQRQHFRWYMIWLSIALGIREDVALVIIGMAFMALVERRARRWWIVPLLMGSVYFVGAVWLSGHINGESYKFLAYYGWLGDSPRTAAIFILTHPWSILLHLFRLQNIMFTLSLILLFAGLPLLRFLRLIPTFFIALALFLTAAGGDGVALQTHYTALFLPFLIWASIEALERFPKTHITIWQRIGLSPTPALAFGLLMIVSLYACFTMSPWRPTSWQTLTKRLHDPLTTATKDLLHDIPNEAAGISSYATIPNLANRMELFSMHYAFRGKRQLSNTPYMPPQTATWALWDARDMLLYDIQYGDDAALYEGGPQRIRQYLSNNHLRVSQMVDATLLYSDSVTEELQPVTTTTTPNQTSAVFGPLTLHTATIGTIEASAHTTIPLRLVWQRTGPVDDEMVLRILYRSESGVIAGFREYPVAYGLYSPHDWESTVSMRVEYNMIPPSLAKGTYTLQIEAFTRDAYIGLDGTLKAIIHTTMEHPLGNPFTLGTITL